MFSAKMDSVWGHFEILVEKWLRNIEIWNLLTRFSRLSLPHLNMRSNETTTVPTPTKQRYDIVTFVRCMAGNGIYVLPWEVDISYSMEDSVMSISCTFKLAWPWQGNYNILKNNRETRIRSTSSHHYSCIVIKRSTQIVFIVPAVSFLCQY
jgi:hypothetical protein